MKALKMSLALALAVSGIWLQPADASSLLVLGNNAMLKRTIIVSPEAMETDSGADLLEALNSTDGTAETPYLIKIEPGIYDLNGSSLKMKPYVDIEGSGQGLTVILSDNRNGVIIPSSNSELRELTISSTYAGESIAYGLYIHMSSPSIRNVTVDVTAGCRLPHGIYSYQADPVLTGVKVSVTGREQTFGIYSDSGTIRMNTIDIEAATTGNDFNVYSIEIDSGGSQTSPVRIEGVSAVASGGNYAVGLRIRNAAAQVIGTDCLAASGAHNRGIYIVNDTLPVTISNSYAIARGGSSAVAIGLEYAGVSLNNVTAKGEEASGANIGFGGISADEPMTVSIDHCHLTGSYRSINSSENFIFYVGASKLSGTVAGSGTWHCIYCYDEENMMLDSTCQPTF